MSYCVCSAPCRRSNHARRRRPPSPRGAARRAACAPIATQSPPSGGASSLGVALFCWRPCWRPRWIAARSTLAKFAATSGASPNYIGNIIPTLSCATLWADLAEWFWGLKSWLRLLGDTLLIAYVGTLLGALGGFCCASSASANLAKSRAGPCSSRAATLEFCRTVPEIVFALMFVVAFGLGPMPGVLAIAIHTIGALGKLFAEVVENIDMKPVEGVDRHRRATGSQTIRFAVLPQVLSNFAQLRAAALRDQRARRRGHGLRRRRRHRPGPDRGDPQVLLHRRQRHPVLLIIATVMMIDCVTERVRHALIGMEARR